MRKLLPFLCIFTAAIGILIAADVRLNVKYDGSTNETSGFVIYYGPSSRNYTNSQRVNLVTNAVVTNLPPNTSLYLSSRAIGFNGFESDLGNELFVTTAPVATNKLPSAVRDFRLSRIGNHIY